MLTQEFPGELYDIRWNATLGSWDSFLLAGVSQFEHVTFSKAGVREIPPPDADLTIAPHADVVAPATSAAGAVVTFTDPIATDVETTPVVVCVPASGTTFAIGSTTVTCTATAAGDANSPVSTSFTVTVTDADLTIAPHADVVAPATSAAGAVVTFTDPIATDLETTPVVVCVPASGTTFVIGATTVTCTATAAGDTNSPVSTTFKVTVTAPAVVAHGSLVRVGSHDRDDDRDDRDDEDDSKGRSGRYTVGASCEYGTLTSVTLNGTAVTNGQVVQLKFNDKKSGVSTTKRGTLVIRGAAFDLVVTCTGWDGAVDTDTVHIARDGKHDEHHERKGGGKDRH